MYVRVSRDVSLFSTDARTSSLHMLAFIRWVIEAGGYFGLALLMFAENVFPPLPSELIMPLAGYVAAQQDIHLAGIILSGTLGSVAGVWFWYEIGRRISVEHLHRFAEKYGRWLTLAPEDITRANDWFVRHGRAAVFLGRLVPTVRTLISVPAGIVNMPRGTFLIYSAAGSLIWTSFLAISGYVLEGKFTRIENYISPVSTGIFVALFFIYLLRVIKGRRRL